MEETRIARNSSIVILSNALNMGISLLVLIYLARYLGDIGFGKYSFVFAYFSIFTVLANWGVDNILVREASKERTKAHGLIGDSLGLKLVLSFSAAFFSIIVINILGYSNEIKVAVYLMSSTLIFAALRETFASIFKINLKMEYYVFPNLVDRIVSAGLIVFIIFLHEGLVEIFAILALSKFLNLVITIFISRKFIRPTVEVNIPQWKAILIPAIPLGISAFFVMIYFRVDVLMLSLMKGDSAVGFYSAAYALTESLIIIPTAIVTASFPLISRYYKTSKGELNRLYNTLLRFMVMAGLPIAVGTTILSEQIISILYGHAFLPSSNALAILIWAGVLMFVNFFLGSVGIAVGREKFIASITGLTALINIVLNLLLIPPFSYIGASLATVLTELIILLLFLKYISKSVGGIESYSFLFKYGIMALVMGAFVYLLRDQNLIFLIILGAIIYFSGVFLMKGLKKEDIELLRGK